MPIILPKTKELKKGIRVKFPKDILEEIERYCQWAKIDDVEHFIIESSKHVLSKDRDWKAQAADSNS